jgi:hypothetical protein
MAIEDRDLLCCSFIALRLDEGRAAMKDLDLVLQTKLE